MYDNKALHNNISHSMNEITDALTVQLWILWLRGVDTDGPFSRDLQDTAVKVLMKPEQWKSSKSVMLVLVCCTNHGMSVLNEHNRHVQQWMNEWTTQSPFLQIINVQGIQGWMTHFKEDDTLPMQLV